MSAQHDNIGRDRFVERDRFFIPAVRVLNSLAQSPHAAGKLVRPTGLSREEVDRALRWLKRRKLVEHDGAWCLTRLGQIATASALSDGSPQGDQGKPGDAVPGGEADRRDHPS